MAEDGMVNIDQLPDSPTMVKCGQYPRLTPHFFYERPDGSILDVSEQEAALMFKQSNNFRTFKQIGVSNGTTLIAYLKEHGYKPGKQMAYEDAQKLMADALQAEIEAARGKFVLPVLAEWAYPDQSVPVQERQGKQLNTKE